MTSNTTATNDYKLLRRRFLFDANAQEIVRVLQKSAQHARALVAADECSIALLDTDKATLLTYSTRQAAGEKPLSRAFHAGEGIEGWVTAHQEILVIDTPEQARRAGLSLPPTVRSLLAIPLLDHAIAPGILSLYSGRKGAFDAQAARLVALFAAQVTMTLAGELQAGAERLEEARARARFFSLLGHELRAPLNTINGYLELAMTGAAGELNGQQYEFVQRARIGSEQLYTLLENLLLSARADNDQLQLNRGLINLQEVVANAVEELELTAADQQVAIEVQEVGNFSRIYADAIRLQQVLRNLLSYALSATPSGGRITITASQDGENHTSSGAGAEAVENEELGRLKLQVRDNGPGIEPGQQTAIFEPFYRVPDATQRRAGGPWLGLSTAKLIIEGHGGQLILESTPGQGSTFTCILPCILP